MGAVLQLGGALTNRRARRRSRVPIRKINVTSMGEAMVVLLIIVMVTAPLVIVGVDIGSDELLPDVALSKTGSGSVTPGQAPVSLPIEADGKIAMQDAEIAFKNLARQSAALPEAGGVSQVFVRGDKAAGLPVTLFTDRLGPRQGSA